MRDETEIRDEIERIEAAAAKLTAEVRSGAISLLRAAQVAVMMPHMQCMAATLKWSLGEGEGKLHEVVREWEELAAESTP